MAEVVQSDSGSPETDKDFELSADMMVHDYDDERTLDEEEALSGSDSGELDDLQKESEMPIEDLLAHYTTGAAAVELVGDNSCDSSSDGPDEVAESLPEQSHKAASQKLNNGATSRDQPPVAARSQTERLLRSTGHQETDESDSSSDDENYEPFEEHKKTIQVGSDFQAVIPAGLSVYGDAPPYENEDRLLWDPCELKDENALNDYLSGIQREVDTKLQAVSLIPRGAHVCDDEQALFLLLQCDNNIEEAQRRRKLQAVPPTDVISLWSEDECRNFEDGLRLYGKNFHEIHHNKVRTRSVYELVHFYYLWKKTERHDMFAAKTRAEKRKYSLHPGTADHLDRFLEEQEVELTISSDLKTEVSDEEHVRSGNLRIFSTGKTTIMSSVRQSTDASSTKVEHMASLKRGYHTRGEVNGVSKFLEHSLENTSAKRLKTEALHPTLDQPVVQTAEPDESAAHGGTAGTNHSHFSLPAPDCLKNLEKSGHSPESPPLPRIANHLSAPEASGLDTIASSNVTGTGPAHVDNLLDKLWGYSEGSCCK